MTPEAQRIAIAEACGYVRQDEKYYHRLYFTHPVKFPNSCALIGTDLRDNCHIPDYTGSLDAMHEAEGGLTDEQISRYIKMLFGVMYKSQGEIGTAHLWRATAPQRAEAFLRTMNLWTE